MSCIKYSYSNSVKSVGNEVVKKFVLWKSPYYYALSRFHYPEYSNAYARCEKELMELQRLAGHGLNVPRIVWERTYPNRRIITMESIKCENVRDLLLSDDICFEEKLGIIGQCSGFLKQMHELGYYHGSPVLQNFGRGDDEIYCFDFEHKLGDDRFPTLQEKQNADLSDVLWSGIYLVRRHLRHREVSPVLDAIKSGYGSIPRPVVSPLIGMKFWVNPDLPRPDLYNVAVGLRDAL